MQAEMNFPRNFQGTIFFPKMLADVFECQPANYDLSEDLTGYGFPIANLLGHVLVTKIRVRSLIHAETPRQITLHRTDIYQNLSLGAPDESYTDFRNHQHVMQP